MYHPQSALDFTPLSHLSFSLIYLPTYLPLVFALFFIGIFLLQACAFWLVGWLVHKHVPSVYSQQNMLVDYYFLNFIFVERF
jgi:hypothetical protein